jgi:rare lipoprotein A
MAIRQVAQLFLFVFVLALAGAMLAGCTQHTVAERSPSRSASLASATQAYPTQAEPRRRASRAHHRRVAAASRTHTPFTTRPAAATDGSVGIASFYKYEAKTASGEQFKPTELTAAHRTLPFGTRLRVTDVATGQSVTVRVNDRGPFVPGRVVDVSRAAAERLGMVDRGITKVKLEVEK